MLPRSYLAIWAVLVYSLFCVARTEALLMASNTIIIDVSGISSVLFSICLLSYAAPEYLAVLAPILGVRAAPCLIFV